MQIWKAMACVLFAATTAQAQTVTRYTLPFADSQPWDVALGADGNMWITEGAFNANRLAKLDPTSGRVTEFLIPSRTFTGSITPGPDGAVWFTEPSGFPFTIGRATTAGAITEFGQDLNTCGPCSLTPYAITVGPDKNIWFSEWVRNAIVKLDRTTGQITFFSTFANGFPDTGLVVGSDGAFWFGIHNNNKIGRMDLAGNVTEFGPVADPLELTLGPDGNVWFTQPIDNSIGRITPAGVISIFRVPTAGAFPRDIVAGPDGNLWFTEHDVNKVGRITPAGTITEVLSVLGGPWAIARGAGNSLWITLKDSNQVAQFAVGTTPPPPPPGGGGNPATLPAPSLVSPAADARFNRGATMTFDWSDVTGASSYTIEIASSQSFTSPVLFTTTVTTSKAAVGTLPAQKMWWRVRANGPNGPGAWTAGRRFEVK